MTSTPCKNSKIFYVVDIELEEFEMFDGFGNGILFVYDIIRFDSVLFVGTKE